MTFNTIENKKMKQYFELSSFCNKLNMNIINSHLKLFTYFLENYSPEKIVTNNILEWSECEIYSNLGMVCDNKIHINKFYMINNKKVKYLKKHTNKRVSIIWCCGIEKYIWKIENNI